jgi:phosphatidylserine/phosphatidylglycerophosphate/cardiolipin synthase-like enzyme
MRLRLFPLLLVIALCVALSFASAQAAFTPNTEITLLASSSDVVPYIDAASQEILVSAYMLRSQVIAEALRRAIVERGVKVYILTTDNGLHEGASYAKSLALAGAFVRSGYANAEILVSDRYYTISGPLIGMSVVLPQVDPTFLVMGSEYANSLVAIYIELYSQAAAFDPLQVRR